MRLDAKVTFADRSRAQIEQTGCSRTEQDDLPFQYVPGSAAIEYRSGGYVMKTSLAPAKGYEGGHLAIDGNFPFSEPKSLEVETTAFVCIGSGEYKTH